MSSGFECEKHTLLSVLLQQDEHTPVHAAQTEPGAVQQMKAYHRGPHGDKISPLPLHNICKYPQTQFDIDKRAHTEMEMTWEDDDENEIYVLPRSIFF